MPKHDPALHRFRKKGFSLENAIKSFFASTAALTIVILVLIIVFLLKEGLGFFPGYRRELEIYRIAGLEFVDLSRKNLTATNNSPAFSTAPTLLKSTASARVN